MDDIGIVVFWTGLIGAALFAAVLAMRRVGGGLLHLRNASGTHARELLAPATLAALSGAAVAARALAADGPATGSFLERVPAVLLGLGLTWLVARFLRITADALIARHDVTVADNLNARTAHTQYRVLQRIGSIAVWTVGVAIVLSTFPGVRSLGNGLLASAGIVGLVLGLAAQRTIGNFLAGIQIALTQPIRLDDAVVIDGEWGWIEDITTTYVVVKIWDERRLIVPFTRILEAPFQNWTRTRADLIGSVMLWTDHSVDVPALRRELERVVGETELWDQRVAVLQVVETSERAVQLRALVSASSSPRAWDLRCFVREKLLDHLRREQPCALPRVRAEVDSVPRARQQEDRSAEARAPQEAERGGLPGAPERG